MGPSIIARNYAETLFALAERNGGIETAEEYGQALEAVAEALRQEPRLREFLETPRLDATAKKDALSGALAASTSEMFIRFLFVVVDKRRQDLLPEIELAYRELVDEALGRVRAEITVAQEPDDALREQVVASLEARLGKTVLPVFIVDDSMLGGLVIRVGDRIFDGSVRNQLQSLRRRLMKTKLPVAAA